MGKKSLLDFLADKWKHEIKHTQEDTMGVLTKEELTKSSDYCTYLDRIKWLN
jgi:hypothetical protein